MTYSRKIGPSSAMKKYLQGKISPEQYVEKIKMTTSSTDRRIQAKKIESKSKISA